MTAIHLRRAIAEDHPFMFEQAARLAAVAELPWHTKEDLLRFQHRFMNNALARPDSESATFIAEDETPDRLGFLHVEAITDSVTLEPCAYVSLLAVTRAAEGRGVTSQLMQAAEDWARLQGFRLIALDVFASNRRARAFYARQGYQDDSLRLTKPLSGEKS